MIEGARRSLPPLTLGRGFLCCCEGERVRLVSWPLLDRGPYYRHPEGCETQDPVMVDVILAPGLNSCLRAPDGRLESPDGMNIAQCDARVAGGGGVCHGSHPLEFAMPAAP